MNALLTGFLAEIPSASFGLMCHESSGGGLEANFELRLLCPLQHLKSQRIRHICIHGCGAANDYSQNGDIEL